MVLMIKIARKRFRVSNYYRISDVLLFISSQKSISIRYFLKIKLKIVSKYIQFHYILFTYQIQLNGVIKLSLLLNLY